MQNALNVLVARAGGTVTITREEYEEVATRYGGTQAMSLIFETLPGTDTLRVTIYRSSPKQGELQA